MTSTSIISHDTNKSTNLADKYCANSNASRLPPRCATLWSLELASEFFHDLSAYDFGGEESRPSDLQAWIEGRIPRRARSRLGRNSRITK